MKRKIQSNIEIDNEKLRAARGSRSLEEVSEAAGVTKQAICRYESGAAVPSGNTLLKLSLLYGCDVRDLAKNSGQKILATA